MSRDTEKLLKELQSFLMQHGDEAADEDSMDRLAEQFLSEQGIHPVDENAAPKTADDYLDLAEQATTIHFIFESVQSVFFHIVSPSHLVRNDFFNLTG